MENLIGKDYVPSDNSYSICLSDVYRQNDYLAGTFTGVPPKVCKIISAVYKQNIRGHKGMKLYDFINVSYDGGEFRVLFHKSNVDADLTQRIREMGKIRRGLETFTL